MIYILLSTYNGERYLPKQLDSIIAQTYSDWRLFARDDGSVDETRAILDSYARKDARITVAADKQNIGAKRSFMSLLEQNGGADYYAFADQDDIWDTDKLEICLKKMQQVERSYPNSPVVIHTDLRVVDGHLQEIAPSFWKYCNIRPDLLDDHIRYMAFCPSVTGCTMLFNKAARICSLSIKENALMHDWWIARQTMLAGGYVVPIWQTTVAYRQHENNVLGATAYSVFKKSWHQRKAENQRMYQLAFPDIFSNKIQFWWWKVIYVCHRILTSRKSHG